MCHFCYVKGLPFPTQEFNAVDVVVRYLVTEQGFAFEDIIIYAWSIGECALCGQGRAGQQVFV